MKTVTSYHGIDQKAVEQGGSVWMNVKRKKRKRVKNDDAGDIEGWKGPWAKYKDEKTMEETNTNYENTIISQTFAVSKDCGGIKKADICVKCKEKTITQT